MIFKKLRKYKNDIANAIRMVNKNSEKINEIVDSQRLIIQKLNNTGLIYISDKEVMSKIFSGAKMFLDPRDISLVPHLIVDGAWEWDITQAWLKVMKENYVVMDIGANFGYFGLLAIQQAQKKCKTIFFEANPNLIPYLDKTIMVNSFTDCAEIENLAIAEKKGNIYLNLVKDFIASSSIHNSDQIKSFTHSRDNTEIISKIRVKSITIDNYCTEKEIKEVNLIKMDIEGYEDRAYEGMRKTIQKSKDITMFVEFSKEAYSNPKDFYKKMLDDFGNLYTVNSVGNLVKQTDNYDNLTNSDASDWVMLVFSKNPNLSSS